MMYTYFRNFDDKDSCSSSGICTTDLRLSSLEELIANELRQLSFYLVKAREHGLEDHKIASNAVNALSISLLNTNFAEHDYYALYDKLYEDKVLAHNMYTTNKTELFADLPVGEKLKNSIVDMTREGEKIMRYRQKNIPEEKKGLFSLIIILIKTAARNIGRIKAFEPDYTMYDFEVLRLYSLTVNTVTREEKLVRRIKEFLNISNDIIKKLAQTYSKNYGEPTGARLRTSVKKGKAILADGLDLKELELILETIKDRPVNVYTHNILFVAHHYPKFREYKNLVGQWGSPNIEYDFSTFPGVIFLGRSFFQKIDAVCRGVMFGSGDIILKGATRIENNNFEPLIQAAMIQEGFLQDSEEYFEELRYSKQEIMDTVANTDAKNITVLVGQHDGKQECELFGSSQVIHIGSPLEIELLNLIANSARSRHLHVRFFFTHCSAQVATIALGLKHIFEDVGIFITKCPTLMVNPRVVRVLEEDFNLKIL